METSHKIDSLIGAHRCYRWLNINRSQQAVVVNVWCAMASLIVPADPLRSSAGFRRSLHSVACSRIALRAPQNEATAPDKAES
jgi:hypothetical protein